MMKAFLVGAMLLSSASLFAAPCLPGTLQNYIDLGSAGCQAGALQFADFFLGEGQSFATQIDPNRILVTPGGTFLVPTLLFTLNSSASGGDLFESIFHFDVTGITLSGAAIGLTSPLATGDGAITAVLDVCPDATFIGVDPIGCPTSPGTAIAFAIADDAQLTDSRDFPLSSFFDVFVDLTNDAGLSGSATLDSATVSIASVPEPGTLLLLAGGLTILGVLRARRV
jgi:hypothetical protein